MTHSIASVRALLEAKSFSAARRALRDMLTERPGDAYLLRLGVEIEVLAEDYKKALDLARQALQILPDDVELREKEFRALGHLGRRREARDALHRFTQDFPQQRWRIEGMTIMLDSLYERVGKLKSKLDEFAETAGDDPSAQREVGIAYHKINDLYRAQRLMLAAHSHFADDVGLNEALALNSFQLVRPGLARYYAKLALSGAPDHGRMRLLKAASYLLYIPPFFVLAHFFRILNILTMFLGWYGAVAVGAVLTIYFNDLWAVWLDLIAVMMQLPVYKYGIFFILGFTAVFLLVTNEGTYRWIFKKNRSVRLRKY